MAVLGLRLACRAGPARRQLSHTAPVPRRARAQALRALGARRARHAGAQGGSLQPVRALCAQGAAWCRAGLWWRAAGVPPSPR